MNLNSRVLALSLAILVSIITTSFLGVFEEIDIAIVLLVFVVSFTATYVIVFIALEFMVFREIKRIHDLLTKLRKKDFILQKEEGLFDMDDNALLNPLQGINREISSYANTKQQEIEELKNIEKFRREFIANVSHELKTPLFAAQGFVHTLLDGAVSDKSIRKKFLKKAARSLDGLDVLVQDLLVLSQIETGDIRMNFEYFDMGKLLNDIIDQFEDKAKKKEINLLMEIESTEEEIIIYGDWQRIKQVMNNLISNAINYTNEGGEVKVRLEKKEAKVHVRVIDSGIGIPLEDKSRIFERFYRVEKSRSRESGGTGLGLAIVKHIIEGHHSTVNVVSTPGVGSEFSFDIHDNEESYLNN